MSGERKTPAASEMVPNTGSGRAQCPRYRPDRSAQSIIKEDDTPQTDLRQGGRLSG